MSQKTRRNRKARNNRIHKNKNKNYEHKQKERGKSQSETYGGLKLCLYKDNISRLILRGFDLVLENLIKRLITLIVYNCVVAADYLMASCFSLFRNNYTDKNLSLKTFSLNIARSFRNITLEKMKDLHTDIDT